MAVSTAAGYPAYSGTFIPEIWSGKLNEKFYAATVLDAISNTNWQGEISDVGDKVKIRQTPDISIDDYVKGQEITYENPEAAIIELVIDKAKKFSFALDDIDEHQSDVALMDDWGEDAGEQMKINIDTDVLGAVYSEAHSSNAGNSAGAISGNISLGTSAAPLQLTRNNVYDFIVDCGTVLDEQNVPENDRFMVLPAWAINLIKRSELRDASLTGDSLSMARNGRVGMIDRFTIYYSNLLNKSSGKFDAIFGQRAALTFASQIVKVQFIPVLQTTFGSAMRGLNVFGWKVVKSEALGHAVIQKA